MVPQDWRAGMWAPVGEKTAQPMLPGTVNFLAEKQQSRVWGDGSGIKSICLHRTGARFPVPTPSSSQPPIAPGLGGMMCSSSSSRTRGTHAYTQGIHIK